MPRCLGVLPQAHLHGGPKYHLLVIVALFAGQAGGCRSKARHAAEGNERRFYAGALLRLLDQRPWARAASLTAARAPSPPPSNGCSTCWPPSSARPLPGASPAWPSPGSAEQWEKTRAQRQDELREFTALVRYLFTRNGVQISVPAELLAQVERRLLDLQNGLTKRQC